MKRTKKPESSKAPNIPAIRTAIRKPRGRWKKGQSGNPATRWVAGQSGNKSGRPKTALLSAACREKLSEIVAGDPLERTYAQYIADALGEKVLKGDMGAASELADRGEGRARQSINMDSKVEVSDLSVLSSKDRATIERDRRLDAMSPEELQTWRSERQRVIGQAEQRALVSGTDVIDEPVQ
jgi:hypothetical protein